MILHSVIVSRTAWTPRCTVGPGRDGRRAQVAGPGRADNAVRSGQSNSVWAIFDRMSIAWRRRVCGSIPPARGVRSGLRTADSASRSDRRRNFAAGAAASAIAVTDHGGPTMFITSGRCRSATTARKSPVRVALASKPVRVALASVL